MATGDKLVNLDVLKTTVHKEVVDLKSAVVGLGNAVARFDFAYFIAFNSPYSWASANGIYSYIIPVKPKDVVDFRSSAEAGSRYAFLKSLDGASTGAVPDFATGYNQSVSVAALDTDYTITAPDDAQYLYMLAFDGSKSRAPSILHVNNYDLLSGIVSNIESLYEKAVYLPDNGIVNAYDPEDLTSGYVLNHQNGETISNQYTAAYAVTDFIPVNYGDNIHLAYIAGNTLCGGCLYDSTKNFVKTIWGTANNKQPPANINTDFSFMIDDRKIAYLRYNVQPDNVYARANQYIWITPSKWLDKQFIVGSNEKFTSLKSVLDYINDNGVENATVHVKPGNYNLVTEYGQSYLDSYVSSGNTYFGLLIGNGTHVIFDEGSYVTFIYEGENTDVAEHFSAFNIIGSCTIENANIYVSNARYCVHEDLPAGSITPAPYTVKYINCTMQHAGNTIGDYTGTVCIGAGTMPNSLSIIDGGMYTCGTQYPWAISCHNFSKETYGNYPSRVVLKNVWINNGLRLGTHSDSVVDVEVTGCKMPSGIREYDAQYFNVTEWNNVMN